MKTLVVKSEKMLTKLFLLAAVLFCTACATEEIEESEISDTPQTALKNAPSNPASTISVGKSYYIKNVGTGKFLDLQNYGNNGVTNVHQWGFHGESNQKWYVKQGSKDNQYKFISLAKPNKCLEVSNGDAQNRANVRVGNRVSQVERQQFIIGNYGNTWKTIANVETDKRVSADLQSRNVHQWAKLNSNNVYIRSQIWEFYDVSNN